MKDVLSDKQMIILALIAGISACFIIILEVL